MPKWREMLRQEQYQSNVVGLAVDEAHLVEKWWVSCVCVCLLVPCVLSVHVHVHYVCVYAYD